MTDHPMEPTPEQLGEWWAKALRTVGCDACDAAIHVARLAYAAGADAEFEACDEWLCESNLHGYAYLLRRARRPKPPSLKEQALIQLQALEQAGALDCNIDAIRRAIEALPEEAP